MRRKGRAVRKMCGRVRSCWAEERSEARRERRPEAFSIIPLENGGPVSKASGMAEEGKGRMEEQGGRGRGTCQLL